MAKIPAVYWQYGDDWTCDGRRVWWEIKDSWCFHVEIAPWPPKAGLVTLTFRYGPDESHMRYAIRTEPPVVEKREEWMPFSPEPQIVVTDHTPWEWQRFSSDGFQSDAPPFQATIRLPAGRVWLAFQVDQQDHRGEWFGHPVLDDWILDVEEA